MFSRLTMKCSLLVPFSLIGAWVAASAEPIFNSQSIEHPVVGRYGMVVSQESHASRVGAEILAKGGNAVDAAVATGFALAVTLPRAGNLGGGGFMLLHLAESGETVAIDYRETAPAAVTEGLFLDDAGEVDPGKATRKPVSVGIPGTVHGLIAALTEYGTLTLADVLAPAIALARDGFEVSDDLSASLRAYRKELSRSQAAWETFFKADGKPYLVGQILKQPDLAETLERIAEKGAKGFYEGETAALIVREMEKIGGLITFADLQMYEPILREPISTNYRGFEVLTMPPPSAGGVILLEMLNMLQTFDLETAGPNSSAGIHYLAEAMKRAYADRSVYLGDPDFHEIPTAEMIGQAYAKKRIADFTPDRAMSAEQVQPGNPTTAVESTETTHFSVVDRHGNAVSNTYTLNHSYGLRHMVTGAGFLLNNELDDFNAKPGAPDSFGLVGGSRNGPQAGKRPLSSMCPTIVLRSGTPWMVTGSPGGSLIPTSVLQVIVNCVDHQMNIAEATHARRVHHQWQPDTLRLERGISPDTIVRLIALGHPVKTGSAMGSTQSIMIDQGGIAFGAADPRRPGALAVGVNED